jgi:2-polyprenyl-3-methyl-5-hydroxy-6-metoxy-1,4-benzoquinol methylase
MLDIGSGSGILSIAAALLGAKKVDGVDIDPVAVKVAKENADINDVGDKLHFILGDLCDKISEKYDIVCANIVADVIISLLENVEDYLNDDALFICSGIIDIREDDVKAAFLKYGFEVYSSGFIFLIEGTKYSRCICPSSSSSSINALLKKAENAPSSRRESPEVISFIISGVTSRSHSFRYAEHMRKNRSFLACILSRF